jgi:hypothetical protein
MKNRITCVSLIQKTAVAKKQRRQKVLRNNNNFISGLRSLSQNVSLLRFLALLRRRKNNTTKTLSADFCVSFFLFGG